MASTILANRKYKVTTTAQVYSIPDGATSATLMGTMDSGTVLYFQSSKNLNGTVYGRISPNYNPSYISKATGTRVPAASYYVRASVVILADENNSLTTTATDNLGTQNIITNIQMVNPPESYTVKTGSTIQTYGGPDETYPARGSISSGSNLAVYGKVKDFNGRTWAAIDSGYTRWISYANVAGTRNMYLVQNTTAQSTQKTATSSLSPVVNNYGNATDASDQVYNNIESAVRAMTNSSYDYSADEDSLEALSNMQYVIGIPPKITPTADIRYMTGASPSNNFGRCYTEMFMMGNTVFSIQPCRVEYLPGFNDDEQQSFFNRLADAVTNGLQDDSNLSGADGINLDGQLFDAHPDYDNYINTVNLLARVMAIYLGIGDKTYGNTNRRYKSMDYSFYRVKNPRNSGGILGVVSDIRQIPSRAITSVINDDTYVHFYMTAAGTSVNENMSVSTKSTGLESLFNNNLSEIAQEIQFLGGGSSGISFDNAIADATSAMQGATAGMGDIIGNIVKYGGNYLKGGRLVFPQMMDDCTYDRSYSGTCRFISPSGDPEAIFINCYLPLCYLLPFVLPQMLSDNMYTYPFLARVNAKGLYHCDLAAITGLRIQRGGQDGTQWTADGLPFEIDVSFDITPLYSKLMVTNARHPILFLSNTALHEYLGAMVGVSFTGSSLELKLNPISAMLSNYLTDTIPSMLRGYYSSDIANWLRQMMTFR